MAPVVNTMGISVLKAVAPPAQILSIVFKKQKNKKLDEQVRQLLLTSVKTDGDCGCSFAMM